MDKRIEKIAKVLVEHSVKVKKGQTILISADILAKPLILEIYKQILQKGAYPRLNIWIDGLAPIYYNYSSEEQLKHFPEIAWFEAKNCAAHIMISAQRNRYELKDTDPRKISLRSKIVNKLHFETQQKPWVGFDYPTEAYAKDAGMSLKEYTDFVFNACLIDWKKAHNRMLDLKRILDNGDKVRIKGKDTDITFSIKGRNAVIGSGEFNMPDGEVFTSPREETVNGHISFTYPAIISGNVVPDVFAEFRNGKLVRLRAGKNLDKLKAKLATDKNAANLGELGIGTNYKIPKFTKNLLFDEKIGGTIHLAFGLAYKMCKGTNKSASHQDIVKDLRPKFGGGEVWVDDKLLIKDGKFMI